MMNFVCDLLGHRRSRRLARPYAGTWRSRCVLCGERLERAGPKNWRPVQNPADQPAQASAGKRRARTAR
jgi:hypothetical protein